MGYPFVSYHNLPYYDGNWLYLLYADDYRLPLDKEPVMWQGPTLSPILFTWIYIPRPNSHVFLPSKWGPIPCLSPLQSAAIRLPDMVLITIVSSSFEVILYNAQLLLSDTSFAALWFGFLKSFWGNVFEFEAAPSFNILSLVWGGQCCNFQ